MKREIRANIRLILLEKNNKMPEKKANTTIKIWKIIPPVFGSMYLWWLKKIPKIIHFITFPVHIYFWEVFIGQITRKYWLYLLTSRNSTFPVSVKIPVYNAYHLISVQIKHQKCLNFLNLFLRTRNHFIIANFDHLDV